MVSPETVARLKAGMTRQQVGFILGTPLIKDAFHANRWDYPYYVRKNGKYSDRHHLVVEFVDDRLAKLEGDLAPVAGLAPASPTAAAPTPDATTAAPVPTVPSPPAAAPTRESRDTKVEPAEGQAGRSPSPPSATAVPATAAPSQPDSTQADMGGDNNMPALRTDPTVPGFEQSKGKKP